MTETIHPAAARGFAETADLYDRARPGYPDDALATIVDRLDLAARSHRARAGRRHGKLTRRLVPAGGRIVALEPVPGMRAKLAAALQGATGHDGAATVEIVDGTAEAIPLPNGSVDAVVAAQAFHWFDAIRALSEVHRVLRPGGRFVLAWNRRDESVPWVKALGDRIRTLAGDEPQVWDERWPAALRRCALFEPWEQADFRQSHRLTREGVLDRVASVSFVAAAEPSAQAEVLADVEALLRDDPATAGLETIDLPYDTEVMWATRRSIEPGLEGVVASVNLNRGGVPKPPVNGTWARTPGPRRRRPPQPRRPRRGHGCRVPLSPGGDRARPRRRAPGVSRVVRREPDPARDRLEPPRGRRPAGAWRYPAAARRTAPWARCWS